MAEVLTGTAAAATSATGTSVTVTLGSAPVAGERLIAVVEHTDDYPNTPSGWTLVDSSAITGVTSMFTKVASGSEGTSLVFTAPTSGAMSARVMRYTGLGAVHSEAANSAEGTNQILFGNLITTDPDVFVVAGAGLHSSTALPASDVTWNSSFTPVAADVKSPSGTKLSMLGVATRTLTSAGTLSGVTASFTPVGITNDQGVMAAFLFASTALDISVGADQSITAAQVATVTGLATGGSGTKTYAWTVTSGATGTFGSPTASTSTFTPTGGVGSSVLRCTVTDGSGSDFDELTLTVTAPPTTATPTGGTSNPTWTPYGGTVPTVLADADTATGVVSATSPTAVVYDETFTTLKVPTGTDDLSLALGIWRDGGSTGTVVARLYEGATLRSTSTSRTLPTTAAGSVTVVFPAADLAAIASASWTSGLRVTATVTAS